MKKSLPLTLVSCVGLEGIADLLITDRIRSGEQVLHHGRPGHRAVGPPQLATVSGILGREVENPVDVHQARRIRRTDADVDVDEHLRPLGRAVGRPQFAPIGRVRRDEIGDVVDFDEVRRRRRTVGVEINENRNARQGVTRLQRLQPQSAGAALTKSLSLAAATFLATDLRAFVLHSCLIRCARRIIACSETFWSPNLEGRWRSAAYFHAAESDFHPKWELPGSQQIRLLRRPISTVESPKRRVLQVAPIGAELKRPGNQALRDAPPDESLLDAVAVPSGERACRGLDGSPYTYERPKGWLFVTQGLDGIEPRRLPGWIKAERHANRRRNDERPHDGRN